ncbi:hypothetical protein OUZ56_001858 [Daphnia magna]|uniref:Uncharacterized protein n=1 Tax=Daphnia magna TaxID=35525 RepID=A0ABR0A4F1_9CRUS|nr:hypothetical protein OUZ56_001858 [Daphnia magna]
MLYLFCFKSQSGSRYEQFTEDGRPDLWNDGARGKKETGMKEEDEVDKNHATSLQTFDTRGCCVWPCARTQVGNGMVTRIGCRKCWTPTGQRELTEPLMDRTMPLLTQLKR